MKITYAILPLLTTFALFEMVAAQSIQGSHSVTEIFDAENIDGTFVVASLRGDILHIHNGDRARERLSPASTFKVFNTLIALDHGVVSSENSPFQWDGTERSVAAWNKDQTLKSAFKVSCVWCYQEIARNVGISGYQAALAIAKYGNQQVGDEVDQFWLNGKLTISAIEQVEFLSRLLNDSMPYSADHVATLKSIMRDDNSTNDHSIYAKTGWTGSELAVGWYVGYVEKGSEVWVFAMNMRMDNAGQASLRKSLTIRALQALGII